MITTSVAKQASRSTIASAVAGRLALRHANHPGAAASGARTRSQSRTGRSNNGSSSSEGAFDEHR